MNEDVGATADDAILCCRNSESRFQGITQTQYGDFSSVAAASAGHTYELNGGDGE